MAVIWQEEQPYTVAITGTLVYPHPRGGYPVTESIIWADDSGTLTLYRNYGIVDGRRNKRPDGHGGYVSVSPLTNAELRALSEEAILVLPAQTSDADMARIAAAGYVARRLTPAESAQAGHWWLATERQYREDQQRGNS